jgi:hypothetical protein
MKAYRGVDVSIHIFLTSAALPSGERTPGTHWIGGLVDPRAGLDDMEKRKFLTLRGLEFRPFGGPARSQSLSRLPVFDDGLSESLQNMRKYATQYASNT